jgi:hypothetical protein
LEALEVFVEAKLEAASSALEPRLAEKESAQKSTTLPPMLQLASTGVQASVISSSAGVSGKVAELGTAIQTKPSCPMTPRAKNALLAMESRLTRMEALNAILGGKLPELTSALEELNERKNKLTKKWGY